MLICKGHNVSFIMTNGFASNPPKNYALLHDPEGTDWPKCSALIAPFKKTREEIDNKKASDYFGMFSSAPLAGKLVMPPKDLSQWKNIGKVEEILYTRQREDKKYFHEFDKDLTLYKLGSMFRLELGSGCSWTWRGFVKP